MIMMSRALQRQIKMLKSPMLGVVGSRVLRANKSTVAAATSTTTTSRCPVTNAGREQMTKIDIDDNRHHHPKLNLVPSLPLLGSVGIPMYSGTPPLHWPAIYHFHTEMHRRFGDFYRFGAIGFGDSNDIFRNAYVITDPNEMLKVVRDQGAYPSGAIQSQWAPIRWHKKRGFSMTEHENGLFGQGEEWKRLRAFLQTDLLSPASAKSYIPGLVEAAHLASKGAPASGDDMNNFLNYCFFDLFSAVMFGELTDVADKSTPTDPDNVEFVTGALDGLSAAIEMAMSPYQTIMCKNLGFETARYKFMAASYDKAWSVWQKKSRSFVQSYEQGQLTDHQKTSYLGRALVRQSASENDITMKEMLELCFVALFAAVDTSSSVMGWNLLHIVANPNVQDKLHDELIRYVGSNGKLPPAAFEPSKLPYLHAVLRETHRLTPAAPLSLRKKLKNDMEIHGVRLPSSSVVALDSFSLGMDPSFVDEPDKFMPERWFSQAVEERKGTAAEILDHPFYKDPFGQGARRCPGSRVASTEIAVLLAQMVLEWKISARPSISSWDDMDYDLQVLLTPTLPSMNFEPRRKGNLRK
mmetsp:Transcript_16617/g.25960  ORF Transcript_16617/g.25960 Transcript_16617/m.25960 type:complete len:580 (-) Transcript_16617:174-1913(-)